MGRLTGKFAIITGSTQGLGARVAERFAGENAAGVLVVGRNGERAAQVAAEIRRQGGHAIGCAANVAKGTV